ncbi:hypothetical protein BH10PSE7_BH10PSE7_28720 [soil metagenome]
MKRIKRAAVGSSAIRSVGYDEGTMDIEFAGGDVYRYKDVPSAFYRLLTLAPSPARGEGKETPYTEHNSPSCGPRSDPIRERGGAAASFATFVDR